MEHQISAADLIINPDGSIYHLNIRPEDLAPLVITVGDPDRVSLISKHFDRIELKKGKREFLTHTGYVGKQRISCISTGIGTDNIDIVFNELDALVNVDFNSRQVKKELTSLELIRIGTSGAIQPDLPMGTILASTIGIGMDALMLYYEQKASDEEENMLEHFKVHCGQLKGVSPYLTSADPGLLDRFAKGMEKGITLTAPGFYAPQGRQVRAKNTVPDFIYLLNSFRYRDQRITNLEMETAGIYALARALGHRALSINAILVSRVGFQFSPEPEKVVNQAIRQVFEQL